MYLQIVICLILAVLYRFYSDAISSKKYAPSKAKTLYIRAICIIFILQSGLRNVAVGADTYAYYQLYIHLANVDWSNIFHSFTETYIEGNGKDPGYRVFQKLIYLLSPNYRAYLLLVAVIFFSSLGVMMNKYCNSVKSAFIGGLVYQVLFYGFFSVTGIRQTLAMSLMFFACRYFLSYKKIIPYMTLCIIAATIHKSALIFIPFFAVIYIKKPISLLVASMCALPFLFFMLRPFAHLLTSFSFTDSYSTYANSTYETQGAQMYFAFMLILAVALLICKKYMSNNSEIFNIKVNAFTIGLFLMPLSWIDPSLLRIAMYFSVFLIFLTNDIIEGFCKKYNTSANLLDTILFIVFSLIIIKRNAPYDFFWNQMDLGNNYGIQVITQGI